MAITNDLAVVLGQPSQMASSFTSCFIRGWFAKIHVLHGTSAVCLYTGPRASRPHADGDVRAPGLCRVHSMHRCCWCMECTLRYFAIVGKFYRPAACFRVYVGRQ